MFHLLKLREAGNKNSKGDQHKSDQKDVTKEKTNHTVADKNKSAAENDR